MTLQGQIALVTGASRGIGQALAVELGRQGATVVGTATSDAGAKAITAYLDAAEIKGAGMVLNVNDAAQTEQVLNDVRKQFGEVSILVNNAGITRDGLLLRMNEGDWDAVLATNLKSVFNMSKAALRPMMSQRAGKIINITSIAGIVGNPGQTNYAASKAGMIGFTKSLAREVGSRNIQVNAVAPGFIETEMTGALNEDQRKRLLEGIPLKRMGKAEEVAGVVRFLASPEADYITGQVFCIDGGMVM